MEAEEVDRPNHGKDGPETSHRLTPLYRETLALRTRVSASSLDVQAKASLLFELDAKIGEFQSALQDLLGLEVTTFRTNESSIQSGGFIGSLCMD